jgi:hypothetical protein
MATIRFLLDENVPASVEAILLERGHTVLWSREAFSPSAPDRLLLFGADTEGLVVVTHDKDFSNLRSLVPEGHWRKFERGAGCLSLRVKETQAVHRLRQEIRNVEHLHQEAAHEHRRFIMTISDTGFRVVTNAPKR